MNVRTRESQKKTSGVLGKLGQKIFNIKDDLTDNIEQRRQLQNHFQYSARNNEKKLVAPNDPPSHQTSTDETPSFERICSINQLAMNFAKRTNNEVVASATSGLLSTDSFRSFNDIFSTENSEHAKQIIMSGVRHEIHRTCTISESTSEDSLINQVDTVNSNLNSAMPKSTQKQNTMILTGPKFRSHIVQPKIRFQRDTLYPISGVVGFLTIFITLWNSISTFFSGVFLGFMLVTALTYFIIRLYINEKNDEIVLHEWIDFPELETGNSKDDQLSSLYTCVEVAFGRYDVNRDAEFLRYPAILQLNDYDLILKLPKNAQFKENQDKQIRFVGSRDYLIKEGKLMLVPEVTLTRAKYWLIEYPIVIDNLQPVSTQIYDENDVNNSSFDANKFFNNCQSSLSIFFETGPDKEIWFHKLSLILRKGKEETLMNTIVNSTATSSTLNLIAQTIPGPESSSLVGHMSDVHNNTVNLEKSTETNGSSHSNATEIRKSETDMLRSQINETDILNDMAQARVIAQEFRTESTDKDSSSTHRTTSMKKKFRKQEENLDRILDTPGCLDEAAITMNFLIRRLLCDVFEETLFKDLMKEKVESKLKEIAVTVLEDLHVETIDLGNTFPVILKFEPMQWNSKGIWFNLFFFYRGSFKITIKTHLVLTRLLKYDPECDQPIYAQHHSAQIVHQDEENIDDDDLLQRQKLLAKEPEIPENAASRKLGTLLTKVAMNKHFQRIAGLKPVAGVIEKLSNAEVGAQLELTSFSGLMTINIPPPPSDRLWIGFPEMPDLNLKVTPLVGESKYSYTLIHDFLEARIRDELKRMLVLPSMDDQLLSFFRDWVIDAIREIASKSTNSSFTENLHV